MRGPAISMISRVGPVRSDGRTRRDFTYVRTSETLARGIDRRVDRDGRRQSAGSGHRVG